MTESLPYIYIVKTRPWKLAVLAAIACLCAASVVLPNTSALAEDIDTSPEADALQQQVERTAAAYDDALVAAREADNALSENAERVEELEKLIPEQQKRSDAAARELYKFQQQSPNVIDLVLSAEDFFGFLSNLDYVNRITETNVAEIARLNEMKAELVSEKEMLEAAKREADENALQAERALTAAQEARLEAQRQAQEAARQAAEAAEAAKVAKGVEENVKKDGSDGTASSSSSDSPGDAAVAVIDDGADWASDEATFVSSWAARIDAYLDGSPLAGQGRTFAQAAWNYGVDPRWSPAISYTESSLGAVCFQPHNAWGWGSSSWDSWEEAIDAHVRGLARGYGYTISEEAAQKYCPPTWDSWYNTTLTQMNMI